MPRQSSFQAGSNQQKSAKSLKPDKVYTLTGVDFCWRSDTVPKESCRNIGRRQDIGISYAK
jgi:hypothetical protein